LEYNHFIGLVAANVRSHLFLSLFICGELLTNRKFIPAVRKMTKATILIIEGKKAERPIFAAQLQKKGFTVSTAVNGGEAVARLDEVAPDLVVVNAASLGSSGVRICQSLQAKQEEHLPIVLILEKDKIVEKPAADVVLNLPFTVQKLVNRLKPLLPGDGNNVIHIGPIRLDMEQRRVRALGKNTRLTPRLATLLQVLLQRHGEVIGREELFKQVWDTNYTGDTRTLDVHISWLRRAIEQDPNHPKFLHTVRGIGYRLDA
jgi:DNA-binding response OmpR family regulator